MLMRSILFDPLDEVEGNWSREQLETMNAVFVARVEAAFVAGLESRLAAAATVQVKSSLNGSRWRAEEAAIEAGWKFLCSKQGDLAFSEIVAFVRERVPGVDEVRVRDGFLQRLREPVSFTLMTCQVYSSRLEDR